MQSLTTTSHNTPVWRSLPANAPSPMGTVPSFDERQGCSLAHNYLAAHNYAAGHPQPEASDLPVFTRCPSYQQGQCGGNGGRDACLFVEPAWSAGWARARRWRLLPSGCICMAENYGEHLADDLAWPAAKPWADMVAYSYGIATDVRGTVLDDQPISTIGADLQQGLAWCLALVGADESAIPHILATWAPAAADPDATIELPASVVYAALSAAALYGVRLAEAEGLLQEVRL